MKPVQTSNTEKEKKTMRFARFNPAKIFEENITLFQIWWNIVKQFVSLILFWYWTMVFFLIIIHILFKCQLIWQKHMAILASIYMNHRESFPPPPQITDKSITRYVDRVANLLYSFLFCPFVLFLLILYIEHSIVCVPGFSNLDCPFCLPFI
jgi:hypothetical protein